MSKPKSGTIKRRNEHGPIGCAQERMFEDSIVANPLRHYETGNQAFSMCLRFLTIRVSDLRQRGLVSFRKKQSALDLGFQDTVLRSQIFVPQQQFLIDGAGDVGQHASPVHSRASLKLIVEPGLYMLLRFQKAAGRGNYETGNQAFSKRLRFLTIRGLLPLRRPGNPEDLRPAASDRRVEPLGDRQERRGPESLLRLCSSGNPLAGPDETGSPKLWGDRNGHRRPDSVESAFRSRPAQGAIGL